MGSYLSRPRPRLPCPFLRLRHPPETPESLGPSHAVGPFPPTCRVHSVAPTLDLTRRLSCENLVVSPRRRRRYRRRFAIVHQRQYPIEQARILFLEVFSSVPHTRHLTPVLPACRPNMFCPSVILKMASTKGQLTLCLPLKETVFCMWSSLSGHLPNPCEMETLMRALKENGQAKAKDKDLTSLVESGEELAKPEERHPVPKGQDDLRVDVVCSGSMQSAFRRLMVNGVLSSFVPRPGPLKRDFPSTSCKYSLIKMSHTCFLSSCSKRNAITSSYSSTGGFPLLPRSFPGTAGIQGPASYQPQVPAKKASEESYHSSSSSSVEPRRKIKHGNVADAPFWQKQSVRDRSPPPDSSRPQKRKIPLLLFSRQHDPLILPRLPQLGYRVTAEDLDLERRAAIQGINKALEGVEEKSTVQVASLNRVRFSVARRTGQQHYFTPLDTDS